jgi:uncharacterized membrane protein
MSAPAYADPRTLFSTSVPKLWNAAPPRSVFGDVVLVVFLLAQCLDGVFTYVGIVTYGRSIEANPLMLALMSHVGHGVALMTAKSVAGLLGVGLHLRGIHLAVALLAAFYMVVAVVPWIAILFG